jgi:MazG family protein
MPQDPTTTGERFERLVGILARLRAPGGCPWDREQNFDTIKPYLLEETYEVFDAVDQRDWPGLAEELGDLMLQAVFFAQMASEEGKFRIDDSLDAICEKLIRRHPHVFGDATAKTSGDVKRRWDAPASSFSGSAADQLQSGGAGLRLGESRPGARQAG